MKLKLRTEKTKKNGVARSAKECAYIAVFVALVISAQLVFAAIPGVELVTILFVAYAFTFGIARGMIAATAFSLLRQIVFGFSPTVLILYLTYYNFLTLIFGILGKNIKEPRKKLFWLVLVACVCTVCFTLLDNVITPLWYGYTQKAARLYFKYSLPVMIPQTVCTAITTTLLFLPLYKTFSIIKKS